MDQSVKTKEPSLCPLSGYRSPAHNKALGGVDGSQHTKGTAADIVVRGVSPLEVAQYAEHLMPDKGADE